MQNKLSLLFILFFLFIAACSGDINTLTEKDRHLIEQTVFLDWYGNEISVQDYRGKIVVIDFWESWCGPCLSAFPGFQRVLDEYPDDIVILAATVGWNEGRDEALRFKARTNYDFVFVDGRNLTAQLGFVGIPFKVILDREGNVLEWKTGSLGADSEYQYLSRIISR